MKKQACLKVLISVHLLDQFHHHKTIVLVSANLLNTTSQLSCHFYIQRPMPHKTEYELSAEEDTVQQQKRNKIICLWVCQIFPDSKGTARLKTWVYSSLWKAVSSSRYMLLPVFLIPNPLLLPNSFLHIRVPFFTYGRCNPSFSKF